VSKFYNDSIYINSMKNEPSLFFLFQGLKMLVKKLFWDKIHLEFLAVQKHRCLNQIVFFSHVKKRKPKESQKLMLLLAQVLLMLLAPIKFVNKKVLLWQMADSDAVRFISSSQHVFDQILSFTSWSKFNEQSLSFFCDA